MTNSTRITTLDANRARTAVISAIQEIGREQTGIINAFRRTLAETIKAEVDQPERDLAATDGFAVISEDTRGASEKEPRKFSMLAESVSAGMTLQTGMLVAVRAGDPLPREADAVLPLADAYRQMDEPEVMVRAEALPGQGVAKAGSFILKGEVLLERGTLITGAEMGLLASLGKTGIAVTRKPKVSVISSGAKMVDLVDKLKPGETRNSARYQLVGMLLEAGCDLDRLTHVTDGRLGIEKAIVGCRNSDAIIVALGPNEKHDLAVAALKNSGEVIFERAHIDPGGATAFGTVDGRPVFIIPSEAALEVFEAIIRPGLLTMMGRREIDRPKITAALSTTLKIKLGYRNYIRATCTNSDNAFAVKPLWPHGPDTKPWNLANSVIVVPEDTERLKRGEAVEVRLLGY